MPSGLMPFLYIGQVHLPFKVSLVKFYFQFSFNRKSYEHGADLDQMPHSAASELGLHCLPKTCLWDASLISLCCLHEKSLGL